MSIVCWFWKLHSKLFHGHEIIGEDNIPKDGPAMILYYHGAIPLYYYYVVANVFLSRGRLIHSVVDKMLFTFPGFQSLFKVFSCHAGPRWSNPLGGRSR